MNKNFPIDVVFTWVDGNDQAHKKKMLQFVKDKSSIQKTYFRTRFDQVNEIEYAVKSVLKYASFVRKIFIVTDNQIPEFLKAGSYNNVEVIDHKEIFKGYVEYLPTFNSISIESLIYKIPNLSEHFIYLNDDCFLINECKREDFFKNGVPVLRGKWKFIEEFYWLGKLKLHYKKKLSSHKTVQKNGAKLIGFKKFYKFYHTPAPFRKSVFQKYFKEHKALENKNVSFRFRSLEQFTIQSLINHLEIKNKSCYFKTPNDLLFIKNYSRSLFRLKKRMFRAEKNKKFLCLQGLDRCPKNKLLFILDWLNSVMS